MDPTQQQQQAINQVAAMGTGLIAAGLLFSLVVTVFFIWVFWRIFTKAGLSGALSLLNLVPFIGPLIVVCILAFSKWNVAPVPPGYSGGESLYPPAFPTTGYPAAGFPPAESDPTRR